MVYKVELKRTLFTLMESQYLGERKASELCGMNISEKQIEKATQHLATYGLSAKFVCSPMEEECGIPADYFDFVYSVYAIGWTTDLDAVFCRTASYLNVVFLHNVYEKSL